ncbi:TP901 family phage tail tape measure protein [Streptomyces sp. Ag109_O5-1]|uniref:phage tail tape measure protein n=1 Tax=Streptomyces sp. Ag109_O5-1 TaxID=1938851 RepID=UPI000F514A1E|nr:phage tail tape measure protein [Streptomyces sp. Ag109_O5-1]RPE44168.1 TP901 family phage tail tape measure protein [Streptomyces sp. Ag109_O5-1]
MASRTAVVWDLIARDHASRTFIRVGEAATGLERRSTSVGAAIGRGLKVGTLAVGALGVASFDLAKGFQASMTKISTQAGGSAKDVQVLSKQVLQLGGKVQQAPEQLADSLYHLKSVGMDNVDAMKALRTASDLAAVGGSNLEDTTNALAGAWRTGIKGATNFGQAASTVNAIIGAGNMTMQDFTDALASGILPTAKTFGLSLQQVGSALALFTDEGVPASDAATRLRMSISLLGAPSGAAEKQLKKIGLTGLDLANAMRSKDGIIGAIQLLKDHLDKSGLSAAQQSQILSRAFGGGKSSSGILSMVSNLDVLKKKQDQVNKSTGKYADAVKAQRATAEAQWKRLTTGLESTATRLGVVLLPPVTNFIGFLNDKGIPTVEHFGAKLLGAVPTDKIKREFRNVEKIVTDFFQGASGKAAKNVATPSVDKGPVMTVPKSSASQLGQQIHDAVATGFRDVDWGDLGSVLGDGIGTAFQWVASHGTDLSKKLGVAIGGIDWVNVGKQLGVVAVPLSIGIIDNLFDPLFHADFWSKHWFDAIIAAVSIIPVGKAAGIGLKLGAKFGEKFAGPFMNMLSEQLGRIPWSRIIPFAEKLGESVGPTLRGVRGWVGRVAGGFKDAFAKRFPRIAQWFEDQLVLLPVRLGDLGRLLKRKGGELVDSMSQGLLDHLPGSSNKFIRAAYKWFGRFTFWQVGVNLAQSLMSGIWSKTKEAGAWLKGHLVDPVINWVKDGFGIHSPSTVFIGIGGNLVAGLLLGILSAAKGIGGWIGAHVIGPVLAPFAGAGSWLSGKGAATVSGFKSGAWSVAKGIGGWFTSHVQNPTVGAFRGAGSWLYSKGQSVTSGLFSGLKQPWGAVQHWVSGVAGWIKAHKGPISLDRQLLHPAGVALMKGLLSGLKVGFKDVGDFVYHIGDSVAGTVKGIASSIGLGNSSASGGAQQFAQVAMQAYGWGPAEWPALKALWNRESGWNPQATNPSSGAYGIPQALPASKMSSAGSDWRTNADTQIRWGLGYIKSRYGSPTSAWAHETKVGWYAKGTDGAAPGWAWVGERGPELVRFGGGETVLNHQQSMAAASSAGIRLPGYVSGTISNAADRVRRDRQKVADAKDDLARAERRRKGVKAAETRLKAAKKELQAAEVSLKNAQRSAKTSIANTIATGLQKTLATGTASAITSAIKSLATKLLNAGYSGTASAIQRKGSKLESLAAKKAGIASQITAANQYASDQASSINDFLSISGTSATSVGGLISQMTGQQKTASSFVTLEKSLKARGASKQLLEQLAEAGPGSQLATILGDKMVTTQDISKLNKLEASGSKLATSFGQNMADLMYDSGKNAGKGFLTGLKSQEAELTKEMSKLASVLVKQVEHDLKIKSPSQVFRDRVGKQVALGVVVGMDKHLPHVAAAAHRVAMTARKAAVLPSAPGRQAAAFDRLATLLTSGQAAGTEVHIHFDDPTLKALIRAEAKPMIKASQDDKAYRAKVGRRNG